MMLARSGKWFSGSDGIRYLVYRYVEVAWSFTDYGTLDCHRGHMYYETSTGLRVIRIGVRSFKIVPTGVYLHDTEEVLDDSAAQKGSSSQADSSERAKRLPMHTLFPSKEEWSLPKKPKLNGNAHRRAHPSVTTRSNKAIYA